MWLCVLCGRKVFYLYNCLSNLIRVRHNNFISGFVFDLVDFFVGQGMRLLFLIHVISEDTVFSFLQFKYKKHVMET